MLWSRANGLQSRVLAAPNGANTDGISEVPQWVCETLNTPSSAVAQIEVANAPLDSYRYGGGGDWHMYTLLLQYFAHHAVNIDEKPPSDESKNAIDPKSDVRQISGRLSSLWYALTKFMNPRSHTKYYDDDESSEKSEDDEPPKPVFFFGLGNARMQIDGDDICIVHKSMGPPVSLHDSVWLYRTVYIFAKEQEILKKLTDAAFEWYFLRNKCEKQLSTGKYPLYTLAIEFDSVHWNDQGLKESRSLSSIILPQGMLDSIVEDFREFNADDTQAWYISHGLPHRRCYLFYGPPGVGKTSTIRALAGALKMSACFLSLGDCRIGNKEMQDALRTIPERAMLIIEDVDALFNEDRETENDSPLTFSGLLNALDGLVSVDGILTVMTTNHIDRLDPALIRAGRVDRKFEFKLPTQMQIKELFLSFYPEAEEELALEFANAVFCRPEKDARSIATLQEHFIFTRRKNARESVDLLDQFFTQFYPDRKDEPAQRNHAVSSNEDV